MSAEEFTANEASGPPFGEEGQQEEEGENDENHEPNYWWEVTRKARTCGTLEGLSFKGKARKSSSRTASFNWVFQTSPDTVATLSPEFSWLDLHWNIRFQKSPYDEGICHKPAWSLFLDLNPPFSRVYRVQGTIFLKQESGALVKLWNFEEDFEPASEDQEVCTWCRRRLDMDGYVQQMKGRDITFQVKLTSWGLGKDFGLLPMKNTREMVPFTFKVGTKTFQRRFGWDLQRHLQSLSKDEISFWKSLRDDPKGNRYRKLKFGPRDMVAQIRNDHIHSIATWKACRELKLFVVDAIHAASNGVAVIPVHLIFFDFDLMDGSDNEDDPRKEAWSIEVCSPDKHAIIVALLDWIVEKPLRAAFQRARRSDDDKEKEPACAFSSIQEKERQEQGRKAANDTVQCVVCSKSGIRKEMPTCSECFDPIYCGRSCQFVHWKKGHNKDCKDLKRARKADEKAQKAAEKKMEEKRAADLLDQYMEPEIEAMAKGLKLGESAGVNIPKL